MPVYWYSIPAQIKGVIDRLFSFVVGGKDIAGKECAVIACCEEQDMSVFDGVRIPMERSAALMKWKMVGEVLVPGVLNVGDIEKTDGCKQAAALAEKFKEEKHHAQENCHSQRQSSEKRQHFHAGQGVYPRGGA